MIETDPGTGATPASSEGAPTEQKAPEGGEKGEVVESTGDVERDLQRAAEALSQLFDEAIRRRSEGQGIEGSAGEEGRESNEGAEGTEGNVPAEEASEASGRSRSTTSIGLSADDVREGLDLIFGKKKKSKKEKKDKKK